MPELPPIEERYRKAPDDPRFARHAADWAETFAPSDTSLAQRRRHNQDITRANEMDAAMDEQAFTERLAGDSGFRDMVFKQRAGQRAQEMAEHKQRLDIAREAFEGQMRPLRMKAQEALIAERMASERRNAAKEFAEARERAIAASDEGNFTYGLAEARDAHGADTPEFHRAVIDLGERYSGTPKDIRAPYVEAARAALEREETARRTEATRKDAEAKAKSLGFDASSITSTGATTFSRPDAPEVKETPEQKALSKIKTEAFIGLAGSEGVLSAAGLDAGAEMEDLQKAKDEGRMTEKQFADANHFIERFRVASGSKTRSEALAKFRELKGEGDITEEAYSKLKDGDEYYFGGKKYTKGAK